MRVVCGSCATKYEVRDERVRGRTVKIRCKRCGEVVIVDGTSEAPPELTAERNESSVLFSLAMLTRPSPDPAPPPPPRTEEIANLTAGGPFAPAFAAPVVPPLDPPPARATWPILAALATGVALVIALPAAAVYAARAEQTRNPKMAMPTATETAAATETATATATDSAAATATGTASAPAAATSAPALTVTVTPTPTATLARAKLVAAPTTPAEPSCCPGESRTACAMRRSVGAVCSESAPRFDSAAARRALASVDLASCKSAGGPSGSGHARITFAPDGSVTSVATDAPFAGTNAGACVAARYRAVRVPAFSGGALAVGKSFSVDPR